LGLFRNFDGMAEAVLLPDHGIVQRGFTVDALGRLNRAKYGWLSRPDGPGVAPRKEEVVMRLAVLSDIHGNLLALEAVLDDIRAQGSPDDYWILGDLVAFCPWPSDTLARLEALPNAHFLRGNTDRYLVTGRRPAASVESRQDWEHMPETLRIRDATFRWAVEHLSYENYEFLRDLPEQLQRDLSDYGRILAVHATPEDDETNLYPDTPQDQLQSYVSQVEARLILYGHTHRAMDRLVGQVRLINGGSVGIPLDGDPRPAYALLDFESGDWKIAVRRVEYDRERVLEEMERLDHPGLPWIGQMIREARA
jgi:putative phosphoesterase